MHESSASACVFFCAYLHLLRLCASTSCSPWVCPLVANEEDSRRLKRVSKRFSADSSIHALACIISSQFSGAAAGFPGSFKAEGDIMDDVLNFSDMPKSPESLHSQLSDIHRTHPATPRADTPTGLQGALG